MSGFQRCRQRRPLGPRLVECVNAILDHSDMSAVEILGDIDAMKFRSCLTLFAQVVPEERSFARALDTFYGGKPDEETLRLLGSSSSAVR